VPRPRAWLTLLAFVLALGVSAHRADAQAFKPRGKGGAAAKPGAAKKAPVVATTPAAAPAKPSARPAAPAPAPRKAAAPTKPVVAKKAPAKKKGADGDDDDVVIVDDEDE